MQRSAFSPIFLYLKGYYFFYAASLAFLACGQEVGFATARSSPNSSAYNETLQDGTSISTGQQEPSAASFRKSLARWLWRRPDRPLSPSLVGAIAGTMCITFVILSCFRSFAASRSGSGTKRKLQNRRPGWLCGVRTVYKDCFLS